MFGKRGFMSGFALGFGTGMVARELVPIVREALTPILRSTVKGGVMAYERGQEMFWEGLERLEDIVAEARTDRQEGKTHGSAQKQLHGNRAQDHETDEDRVQELSSTKGQGQGQGQASTMSMAMRKAEQKMEKEKKLKKQASQGQAHGRVREEHTLQ